MSLSQRIEKAKRERELRDAKARLKRISTREQIALLRADAAR